MMATARMIGFSGHVEISQDSVPLIGKALRDRLGTMHGPFVGITMMRPGADRVFARVVLETGGHLHVVMPTLGFQYRDEFEDPGARGVYDQLFARATYAERVANYRWSTIESHLAVVKRWSTPAMCSMRYGMGGLAASLVMLSTTHETSGSRSSGSGRKVSVESCRRACVRRSRVGTPRVVLGDVPLDIAVLNELMAVAPHAATRTGVKPSRLAKALAAVDRRYLPSGEGTAPIQ